MKLFIPLFIGAFLLPFAIVLPLHFSQEGALDKLYNQQVRVYTIQTGNYNVYVGTQEEVALFVANWEDTCYLARADGRLTVSNSIDSSVLVYRYNFRPLDASFTEISKN